MARFGNAPAQGGLWQVGACIDARYNLAVDHPEAAADHDTSS
jgi:hypothetical protein